MRECMWTQIRDNQDRLVTGGHRRGQMSRLSGFGREIHAEDFTPGVAQLQAMRTAGRQIIAEASFLDRTNFSSVQEHLRSGHIRRDTDGMRLGFKIEFRSEEHTSELQSQSNLVCRLL